MRKQIIDMSFNTLLLTRGISVAMFFLFCSVLLAPCYAAQQPAGKVPRIGFLTNSSSDQLERAPPRCISPGACRARLC